MSALHPYLESRRPLLFAHRGGAGLWPENTLVAFEGALALGYQYVETDVHETRDGELVLFHDERVDRTTDGVGRVDAHSLAELKRLDAGYRFSLDGKRFPQRGRGVRIPTLGEALALDPELRLNLEIKPRSDAVAEHVFRYLEQRDLSRRVLGASADQATGDAFRRLALGRYATSPGASGIVGFWLAAKSGAHRFMRFGYDALQVPVRQQGLEVVTPRFVEAAHAHGMQVHVWTVDDEYEMRRLIALGVDGLMTDRPDVLARVVRPPRARVSTGA
jgi:glycerophosphoryl diester phosphodiesterase